jgi:hypothetical protein
MRLLDVLLWQAPFCYALLILWGAFASWWDGGRGDKVFAKWRRPPPSKKYWPYQ